MQGAVSTIRLGAPLMSPARAPTLAAAGDEGGAPSGPAAEAAAAAAAAADAIVGMTVRSRLPPTEFPVVSDAPPGRRGPPTTPSPAAPARAPRPANVARAGGIAVRRAGAGRGRAPRCPPPTRPPSR